MNENERKMTGSVEVSFKNATGTKKLVDYVSKEPYRVVMQKILVEVNAEAGTVDFVSCDGYIMGVVNNKANATWNDDSEKGVFQALFHTWDWKEICDYAKETKSAVKFEIYKRIAEERSDTMIAVLGDKRIESTMCGLTYPRWQSVIPTDFKTSISIHPEDVKAAQNFIRGCKVGEDQFLYVSCYQGSDIAYLDQIIDNNLNNEIVKTWKFRLDKPAETTSEICYKLQLLKKVKFTGFNFNDKLQASTVDCENADLILLMPSNCSLPEHVVAGRLTGNTAAA